MTVLSSNTLIGIKYTDVNPIIRNAISVTDLWTSLPFEVIILENIKMADKKSNGFTRKIAAENPVTIPPINTNSESIVALVANSQVRESIKIIC